MKEKVTLAFGRMLVEALQADNTTVDSQRADLYLGAGTTITGFPDSEEVLVQDSLSGDAYTVRYKAVHTFVDAGGSAIAGITTYATFKAFLDGMRAAQSNLGLQVDLQTADPNTVDVSAAVNNQALPGSGYTGLKMNVTVASDLTGIVAPTGNEHHTLFIRNVGTQALTLKNENGGSTAENRILTPGAGDKAISVNGSVLLAYDSTTTRWYVINTL